MYDERLGKPVYPFVRRVNSPLKRVVITLFMKYLSEQSALTDKAKSGYSEDNRKQDRKAKQKQDKITVKLRESWN